MAYFCCTTIKRHLHIIDSASHFTPAETYREIRRVTLIGSVLDLVLGIVKIIVGFVSHSQALVADGVHSFSDLASDVLVIVAARHAAQGPDQAPPLRARSNSDRGIGFAGSDFGGRCPRDRMGLSGQAT